jgi:hypothetical protein
VLYVLIILVIVAFVVLIVCIGSCSRNFRQWLLRVQFWLDVRLILERLLPSIRRKSLFAVRILTLVLIFCTFQPLCFKIRIPRR